MVDVASMFKRGKMLSELKTFEQASHRIVSYLYNNYSCSYSILFAPRSLVVCHQV